MKNGAVALNIKSFSADTERFVYIIERDNSAGMYEFNGASIGALGAISVENYIVLW